MVVEGKVLNNFPRFVGILIAEFAADGVVNLALKMKGDMIIENLDLKPTIDAMMRNVLEALRSFPMERIEQGIRMSIRFQPDGVGSKRYHVVPFEELDGIPIALVA
ncbi:hypothetical protein Tco_0065278 [Tanacetum coccineum]